MPSTFRNHPPSDDEETVRRDILQQQMRLMQTLNSLSYITTDAVLLIPRREDTEDALSVSLAYVTRSDTEVETRITNELAKRVTQAVKDWQAWVREHIKPNHDTPF